MTATIISAIISLLIGTGALSWYLRFNTRMVLVELKAADALRKAEEADLKSVENSTRIGLLKQTLDRIETSLNKLDKIDQMQATLESVDKRMDDIVPRNEQESRWKYYEKEIDAMHDQIAALQKELSQKMNN